MSRPDRPRQLDRSRIRFRPVAERRSKFRIEDIAVDPDGGPLPDAGDGLAVIREIVGSIRRARAADRPVIICHGAHLIKNGLAPVLIRLVEEGWLTHVATNGAGSIHDWEFAFLGRSTEDVRENVARGEFGTWKETGAILGLALLVSGLHGQGYGAAVGGLIEEETLLVPPRDDLIEFLRKVVDGRRPGSEEHGAAADLLAAIDSGRTESGPRSIPHPWKHHSIQAVCHRQRTPFTVHPGIGQDITYTHPLFMGASVGRAAMVDFLAYAAAIKDLQDGVYLSVGSSVMSPMIFEKALSMARNLLHQEGQRLDRFTVAVNDLARVDWDWSRGEPPADNPAYYVRFMKTFSRMGGQLVYAGLDNRTFLLHLYHELQAAP